MFALTALSLAIFVMASALLASSFVVRDDFVWTSAKYGSTDVIFRRGEIQLGRGEISFIWLEGDEALEYDGPYDEWFLDDIESPHFQFRVTKPAINVDALDPLAPFENPHWGVYGFDAAHHVADNAAQRASYRRCTLPLWSLSALGTPLTLRVFVIARLLRRSRRRARVGLCPRCGYDIRASRERCSECGSEIAKIGAAS